MTHVNAGAIAAQTDVITMVGKTWTFTQTGCLGVSLDENIEMITDSVAFLKGEGREVIYDAEHFFDGWKANSDYAARTIVAAAQAGASLIVCCDTNGGTLPEEIVSTRSRRKPPSKRQGSALHSPP